MSNNYTIYKDTENEFIADNVKQIAEHFNINYFTLKNKINSIKKDCNLNNLDENKIIEIAIYRIKNNIKSNSKIFHVKKDIENGIYEDFNGNIKELSDYFNIKHSTLINRIYALNMTPNEAIAYENNPRKLSRRESYKVYTVFKNKNNYNTDYKIEEFTGTLREIANNFNINYTNLIHRINKNNNRYDNNRNINDEIKIIENSIIEYYEFKNKKKDYKNKIFEVNTRNITNKKALKNIDDKNFTIIGNYKFIANYFNIKPQILLYRLYSGKNIEEAINTSNNMRFKKGQIFVVEDKENNINIEGNVKEIANHFNIKYKTLLYRMSNYNLNIQEAVDFKNKNKNNKYIIVKYHIFKNTNNEFIGNKKDIANYFNINYNNLLYSIKKYKIKNKKDNIDETDLEKIINNLINY